MKLAGGNARRRDTHALMYIGLALSPVLLLFSFLFFFLSSHVFFAMCTYEFSPSNEGHRTRAPNSINFHERPFRLIPFLPSPIFPTKPLGTDDRWNYFQKTLPRATMYRFPLSSPPDMTLIK